MILVIDNFDSFTYNIVQYLQSMGQEVLVKRNNQISLAEIKKLSPHRIIISPGPGRPDNAGLSLEIISHFKAEIPILGVCLGHQCIGQALGAKIICAQKLYHGKTSVIEHDGLGIFKGLKTQLIQTRYHSLVIDPESLPDALMVTARSEDGEIMGIRHKTFPLEGVQFHPESVASEKGYSLLENFISQGEANKMDTRELLKKLWAKSDLEQQEASFLMEAMAEGQLSPTMISALLTALSLKGETIEEITGFAKIMRARAVKIATPQGKVVDNCGTGGDKSGTFNISTVASMVLAGAGLKVAKHGNRSITSKCGSADLFSALGVNLDIDPKKMEAALFKIGMTFLFAQKLHPAMKHVVGVRKELGMRTVFNLLGPLANPAHAEIQLIGVFERAFVEPIAHVLKNLGSKRAMVVYGEDGLDEITLTGNTYFAELRDGWIRTGNLHPRDFGLEPCSASALKGGDVEKNKKICEAVLKGEQGHPLEIVCMNAGTVLYLAEEADTLSNGYLKAKQIIASGEPMNKIKQLAEFTQRESHA